MLHRNENSFVVSDKEKARTKILADVCCGVEELKPVNEAS
jgi:hypothetical protein